MFPILDATCTSVSRTDGQRSGLQTGGGISCRPNPAATLLVYLVSRVFTGQVPCVADGQTDRPTERQTNGKRNGR